VDLVIWNHSLFLAATTDGYVPTGGDFLADTSTLPHPQALHLRPLDSLPPAEQPPHCRDTPGKAWPNIGGQAHEPVVAPSFTDGDHSVFVPAATDGNIPTGNDFLSDTSTSPQPQAHHLWPLDSLALVGHPT